MEDLKAQLNFFNEAQIQEIIKEAKEQAAKIVSEAQAKAGQIKSSETKQALQKARETEEQELESVRLQGKRKVMNARFRNVGMVLEKSQDRLKELADQQDPLYLKAIERFVVEGAASIAGEEFEVVVSLRDATAIKQRLRQLEKEASTMKGVPTKLKMSNEPLRSIGGVVVRSKDGKQIFNNTLEARLAKVRQEMLPKINDILSGGTSK
jgi:V/A-type H+-transporting ATPase subunit E